MRLTLQGRPRQMACGTKEAQQVQACFYLRRTWAEEDYKCCTVSYLEAYKNGGNGEMKRLSE